MTIELIAKKLNDCANGNCRRCQYIGLRLDNGNATLCQANLIEDMAKECKKVAERVEDDNTIDN